VEIKNNYPLKSLNTFNINVDGKYYTEVASVDDIREAVGFANERNLPVLLLGGGSNILFMDNFSGLVVKVNIGGKEVIKETNDHIFVKAGAGENWDEFVKYCVDRGFAGIENLSLIPGNVGASPIQNIGAYGVELKDHFDSLEYYHFEQDKIITFRSEDCQFGYRNSIFKNELKGKGVILSVTLRLDKEPSIRAEYGSIKDELASLKVTDYTIAAIRQAVINIRQSKLPDPAVLGNAGSFFKNPEVSREKFEALKRDFPGIVGYPVENGNVKLAAGWLIDQCGWKGYREGEAGIHKNQALVIVNHGNAKGKEIFNLSEKVLQSVADKFGVELVREVNVV